MNNGKSGCNPGEAIQYACHQCGAALRFEAGTGELRCPYCGSVRPIPPSEAGVAELDYAARLQRSAEERGFEEVLEVPCDRCGARTVVAEDEAAGPCPFCAAPMVYAGKLARRIKPEALLPFGISRKQALERLRSWIGGLWFAPGDLGRHARIDDSLTGVYVPYWTYDALTRTRYRGERGDHYYTTENRTFRERGRMVTRPRRVRHTRWSPSGGTVVLRFDDILIRAGRSLPAPYADLIEPWDLANLVPYSGEYLSGFRAEAYQVRLEEGFARARERMEPGVESAIRQDIGGDEQRIHSADTEYSELTFKHILLPVWTSVFRFRGKKFPILVNARTGEVQGDRPYSAWKIAGAAALVLAVLALLLLFGSLR